MNEFAVRSRDFMGLRYTTYALRTPHNGLKALFHLNDGSRADQEHCFKQSGRSSSEGCFFREGHGMGRDGYLRRKTEPFGLPKCCGPAPAVIRWLLPSGRWGFGHARRVILLWPRAYTGTTMIAL